MMEIEKLKDMLNNAAGGPVGVQMCHEAADAIEQLQSENEKLRAERDEARADCAIAEKNHFNCAFELEKVKVKLDAAVESIRHECKTCVYHTVFFNGCTLDHDCTNPDGGCSNNYDRWRWRGPH